MFKTLIILLLIIMTMSCTDSVQCEEDENTIIWRKQDSPIIVDSLVHVGKEQTLIIEKGVEVLLKSDYYYYDFEDTLGIAESALYLYDIFHPHAGLIRVDGKLYARGTSSEQIVFTRRGEGFWGSIYADSSSVVELENCHISYFAGFYDKRIPGYKPFGVFLNNSTGKIINCSFYSEDRTISLGVYAESNFLIRNNQMESMFGIAVKNSSPIIDNNLLLVENFGILVDFFSKPKIVNNTIVNAYEAIVDQSMGQDSTIIMNNILWNVRMYYLTISTHTQYKFENNLIKYYGYPERDVHESNIFDLDPLFVDEENGDYRLRSDSPAKDMGSTEIKGYEFPEKDYYGNKRVTGSTVDIGAAEITTD